MAEIRKYTPAKVKYKPWVVAADEKPKKLFELVQVKNTSCSRQMAWWTGQDWDAGLWHIRSRRPTLRTISAQLVR